ECLVQSGDKLREFGHSLICIGSAPLCNCELRSQSRVPLLGGGQLRGELIFVTRSRLECGERCLSGRKLGSELIFVTRSRLQCGDRCLTDSKLGSQALALPLCRGQLTGQLRGIACAST